MTKQKLSPAPGYLLVQPIEEDKETSSGIVLPESVDKKPLKGKVLAVGSASLTDSGAKVDPWSEVKKGAVIVYKEWAGNEYKQRGQDQSLLFVKFEDVLAVIK